MAQTRLQSYFRKCPRSFTSSPTRMTPVRPTKRIPLQDILEESPDVSGKQRLSPVDLTINSLCASAQLQLSFSEAYPSSESHESTLRSHWSKDELLALVQFVIENGKDNVWATHQHANVWSVAATFIQRKVGTAHVRTSMLVDIIS